jgi:hypothetical protein
MAAQAGIPFDPSSVYVSRNGPAAIAQNAANDRCQTID